LSAALSAYVQGQPGPGVSTAHVGATGKPKVAFLFTGQGAQYAGMGRQLYETEPVFRAALDQCDVLLTPLIGESLLNVLYPSNASPDQAARIDHTRYTQPALFAIEYALAALWQSWGIEPYAVMGHSVGEYAAACVAGVFSLEDGVKLIAARGRLMGSLPAGGEMAAVFAPLERVQAALAQTPTAAARVSIAAMNGPENIVLSGAGEALREITARLETQGVKSRPLAVSHAFHSPLMDPILDEFERLAAGVRMSAPRHKLISNLTAGVAGDEVTQAGYRRRHIRQPVRFAESIAALAKLGCTAFVEIGPNPTLLSMAQRCLPDETAPSANLTWLPSLRKGQPEDETMLSSLGKLYTLGADIEWQNCAGSAQARKVALPTYPFQRQRYWMSTRSHASAQVRAAGMHPLLGSRLDVAHNAGIHIWQGELDLERLIYLQDHRIQGLAILPITAYLEMATAAAVETYGPGPMSISEVKIHKPLLLSDGAAPFMQMVLIRQSTDEFQFQIYSRPEKTDSPAIAPDEWTLHAQGLLQRLINPPTPHIFETPTLSAADFAEIKARCDQELTGEAFYRQMSEKGNQWGPAFQGVDHLWFREGEALSQVKVLPGLAADVTAYRFHPAVADSAGHVIAATLLLGTATAGKEGAFVAGGMDQSIVYQAFKGSSLWAYARLRPSLPGQENVLIGDVAVYDETGALIFETVGARLFYLDPQQQRSLVERVDHWMYAIQMEALPEIPESAIDAKTIGWLLFAEPGEIADALDEHLRRRGHVPVRVEMGGHFARHSDHRFVVDPLLISDFHQLFETIDRNPGIPPIGGIAYLWGLDMPAMDSFTGENSACDLLQAQERLLGGVIHIAQAVQTLNLTVPPRIWIVTQRAMPPLEEGPLACNPLQSALWGLGKSLAGEHGELWGGLIDLDTTVSPAHIASSLVASFTAPDPEDQVAWRNGRRYGLRLSRYKPGPKKPLEISADGAYWITGGLGGLGLQAASWLVQHGARRLVLFSRSKLPPQADWPTLSDDHPQAKQVHAVQALQELGANIWPAPVDVADQAAMDAFWHEYQRQKWPSVRGVIHAAGTMQYRLLRDHSLADLRELLRPKLAGAWLLHEMLRHQPLDFFVLYSSTSALLNSPLMASYAAANAFLDGFAYYRKQAGLPAVSINWGTWGEAGMALAFANVADQDSKDPRAHVLSGTITNQQGLQALEAVLSHADTQIAVTPVDWQSWQKKYPLIANAPFLSKLLQPGPQTTVAAPAGFDWNAFKAAVPAEKASLVRAHLSQLSAGILGFGDGGLDVNLSLSTLGLDSLMAIDLKKRIETNLKVNVPVAQILVGPSLSELTAQVLELLSRAEPEMAVALPPETKGDSSSPNETQPTAVETTSLLQDLDQFSDDDVDRMLRSMLNPKDSP
jgi:acyl transferase domain-containing protein